MIVDRPFFFAIYDNSTDTMLFMGSIFNPIKSNTTNIKDKEINQEDEFFKEFPDLIPLFFD